MPRGKSCVVVTGANGQDGSNMIDFLLESSAVDIIACVRRHSTPQTKNIKHLFNNKRVIFEYLDLSDEASIENVVEKYKPSYFLNFAANSFVAVSWKMPSQVMDVNTLGVLRCLEAIKKHHPKCRFMNMGSSEEFGDVLFSPQTEDHPLRPRSPYGASKAAARHLVKVYRESYGIFAIQPWCFNHEGPRRGEDFVTRKITKNLCRIKEELEKGGIKETLKLGNLDSVRDWSDSRDIVAAIWEMVTQLNQPEDLIVCSENLKSVREFLLLACKELWPQDEIKSEGFQHQEKIYINSNLMVEVSKEFYRPAEVDVLHGSMNKFKRFFPYWKPKFSMEEMIKNMLDNDYFEILQNKT